MNRSLLTNAEHHAMSKNHRYALQKLEEQYLSTKPRHIEALRDIMRKTKSKHTAYVEEIALTEGVEKARLYNATTLKPVYYHGTKLVPVF